jgi:hypothetical protein
MARYFIDAEPDGNRVIKYFDLNVSSCLGISSKPRYQLDVHFNLTKSLGLVRSNNGGSTNIGTSQDLALLNVTCELTFETENNSQQRRIELKPTQDSRLYVGGNTIFSTPIDAMDAEYLNSWRKGKTILIKWKISGHTAIIDSTNQSQPSLIFWLDASNTRDNRNMLPSLDSIAFASKILKPLKLSSTFIQEFPLEIPDIIIRKAPEFPSGIAGILNEVYSLVKHLNSAVEVLRNAKTGSDYRHVMDEVKSSLDSIRDPQNKKELGKELLVETSIIGNVDPPAGDLAAKDVIDKFLKIMDNAYWIASKPAHTKSKDKPPKRFSMNPDRTDAIFVLTVGLASCKFLLERIEHYIATVL